MIGEKYIEEIEEEKITEDLLKKWDSILYPQMYSVAQVKDFIKKTVSYTYNRAKKTTEEKTEIYFEHKKNKITKVELREKK